MSRSVHKVSTTARMDFTLFDSADAAVTTAVDGDFTKVLVKDGASSAVTVTVSHVTSGVYEATFTPTGTGVWYLNVRHATNAPRGFQHSWDVTTDGLISLSDITGAVPASSAIADAVWDEAGSGHVSAGTFGARLDAVVSTAPPAASAIADAVWDEAGIGHVSAGTFGARLDAVVSTAPPTANANADALLDRTDGVETGVTVRSALRYIGATTSGECTVVGSTVTFKGLDDSTTRVTSVVNASTGARETVTLA